MKLSDLKNHLNAADSLNFMLPNGTFIPAHFHITEAGFVTKHFIDCGGQVRNEKTASLQIWVANDLEHRLEPKKLLNILAISEKVLGKEDPEVEIEYQTDTIGKYGLEFYNGNFVLTVKNTDCLAKENCGVPPVKQKLQLAELTSNSACCTPGGGCC